MRLSDSLRRRILSLVPAPARPPLRRIRRELPHRLRDSLPDFLDLLRSPSRRLPPASLRAAVGLTSSRREFRQVGRAVADCIEAAFLRTCRGNAGAYLRWLDFGCGSGRVLRHLERRERRLWGADVDAVGLKWAEKHLPDCRFSRLTPTGPAPFPASSFDVVVAVSVFTHLEEASQTLWLREIQRILRPGGYFLCSTHSAALTYTRPDLTESQLASLSARGFLFAPGGGPFSEDSAFHSRDYLERTWGAMFAIREFAEFGLAGYQDLSVWERRPPLIGAR